MTDSDLDNSIVPLKIFEAERCVDTMQGLRADRRRSMTTKEVAEKRLEVLVSGNEKLINGWWFNYFDTPDAIGYFNNEIKIIRNLLTGTTLDAKLGSSVLVLTVEQYKKLKGRTFDRNGISTDWLTREQAKEHPIWQELLGEILEVYVDAVFEQYKKDMAKLNLWAFPLRIRRMSLLCAPVASAGSTAGPTSTDSAASSVAVLASLVY